MTKDDKQSRFQKYADKWIDRLVLRFIPHSVKPNQVTVLRLLLVPVVYWLLINGYILAGMVVFIFAALTDAIDGAMARTRHQITDVGKVIDPLADKLLIISVLFYIGLRYLIIRIFVIFIVLEMLTVVFGYLLSSSPLIGRPIGSNVFGKIKLNLQAFSIGLFLLGSLVHSTVLVDLSLALLVVAFVLACLAGVEVTRRKLNQIADNSA